MVGWGTMNFFSLPNLSTCTLAMGLTQPLTEMSTRKCFCREHGRRVRLTSSTPSLSWLSRQCGVPNISQPYRLPRPVMGIALLWLYFLLLARGDACKYSNWPHNKQEVMGIINCLLSKETLVCMWNEVCKKILWELYMRDNILLTYIHNK
jgi:hypothetical protein